MKKKIPNKIYFNSDKTNKFIEINPRGFCHGVINSYYTAKKYLKQKGENEKVYMLGRIVHNDIIVKELAAAGLIFIEDINKKREDLINELPDNCTVIFSAHGTSPKAFIAAEKKGIKIIDTTCDRVYVTHDIVKQNLNEGRKIIFVGTKNHPETMSIKGIDEDNIHIIYGMDGIDTIPWKIDDDVFVTNQTTLSILDVAEVFKALEKKYKNLKKQNDICYATYDRQTAILDLKGEDIDLLVVVGDKKSNNSNKLVDIGKNVAKKSILIQTFQDLDYEIFKDQKIKVVALSSGASTPTQVTKEVSNKLKHILHIE